jgi:hypothetical protein
LPLYRNETFVVGCGERSLFHLFQKINFFSAKIQKYKNTKIQKYKNTKIQKYKNTKIHKEK